MVRNKLNFCGTGKEEGTAKVVLIIIGAYAEIDIDLLDQVGDMMRIVKGKKGCLVG